MNCTTLLKCAAAAMLLLATACKKDKPVDATPTLSLDKGTTPIEFSAEATETFTYEVTTNQDKWDAVSSQEWCKVTKSSKSFILTATPNTTTTPRPEALVTVTAGKASALAIKVTQKAVGPMLSISPAPENGEIVFPAEGKVNIYTVSTNQSKWDAVSDKDWCVVDKSADGNGFTLTVAEDISTTAKESATLTITAGDAEPLKIKVTQLASTAILTISPSPEGGVVDFPAAGETKTFTVSTNQPEWNVASDKEWCVAAKSEDGTQFTLTAARNGFPAAMEDATVTVSAGDAPDVVLTAKQAGTPASVFGDDIVAAAEYGGGDGTAEKPFLITSAAELKKLLEETSANTAGKYYRLEADINVTAARWIPIGINANLSFKSNFDGNGHTVSGKLIGNINKVAGFFGYLGGDAVVRNLTVDADVENTSGNVNYTGAIAGYMNGNARISGCTAKGTVKSNANTESTNNIECYTGGIAGLVWTGSTCAIEDCTNFADVFGGSGHSQNSVASCYTGGIIGNFFGTGPVTGCTNNGSVTGGSFTSGNENMDIKIYTGGIAGYLHSTALIHLSGNSGAVTKGSGKTVYIGGITGVSFGKIYSCNTNTGTVDGQPASDGNRVGQGSVTACPEEGH